MTVLGQIMRGLGLGGYQLASVAAAGPASYAAGGFTIVSGLRTLMHFQVLADNGTFLAASDTGYALKLTVSGGTVTVQVWEFSAGAWAQTGNGGNFSTNTFRLLAIGV